MPGTQYCKELIIFFFSSARTHYKMESALDGEEQSGRLVHPAGRNTGLWEFFYFLQKYVLRKIRINGLFNLKVKIFFNAHHFIFCRVFLGENRTKEIYFWHLNITSTHITDEEFWADFCMHPHTRIYT